MTRIKKKSQASIAITQSFPAPKWLGFHKNISPCSLNSVEEQCWAHGAKIDISKIQRQNKARSDKLEDFSLFKEVTWLPGKF